MRKISNLRVAKLLETLIPEFDLILLLEADQLDRESFSRWEVSVAPGMPGFKVLARKGEFEMASRTEDRDLRSYIFTLRRRNTTGSEIQIVLVHGMDKRNSPAEEDRRGLFGRLKRLYVEGQKRTVIVGDLNSDPWETPIIGVHGLNAVPDARQARKVSRRYAGEECAFTYNPSWYLFGESLDGKPVGTYFRRNPRSLSNYWALPDQVVLSPDLISHFCFNEFKILTNIGDTALFEYPKFHFSDHLPIQFKLSGI